MRLIRLEEVRNLTALSRSAIYRKMKAKEFPQTVNLGDRSVAWVEEEVRSWIHDLVEARNE
ncbi:AlpA family transcriptional regulator [Vibrio sp. 1288]|uniref:AlpA family transcriptional regulator n=1 Tax=Vibrio sp. 1288 TaxID=3074550 RepID=UPI00296754C5|nr:AlpA family transcriptional regulator [Vibrio sp. 1288]MDW3136300.1 AlpA family transcriptional regulator [Vibrio sp. 1288]